MSQNPNLFLSIGKPIKDEYGRTIGKIASFALTPSGKFDAVFIEQGDGKFLKHSVEHLKMDGADVKLTSGIKSGASAYCDQIPLIWRKDQALKDLTDKKKISRELYEELHNNFDGALSQLKTEAQNLIEEIEKQLVRLGEERRQLNYALVHLEIEHEIGKIDNQSYDTAFAIIHESLKQANDEKGDLELMKSKLSSILLGEARKIAEQDKSKEKPKTTVPAASAYELPEPPVVVYVKEIGRTGI